MDFFQKLFGHKEPTLILVESENLGEGDYIKILCVGWGLGMGHIRIVGGLMPGGRKNMEFLARLMTYGRLDVSPMLTHKFDKFEDMETAILLMKDKPKDLIKPVIRLA